MQSGMDYCRRACPSSDGRSVRLPQPTMPDGLDASGQEAVLTKVADDRHSLDDLMQQGISAPFQLKIEPARETTPDTPIFQVDLLFLAYGDWGKIHPKDVGESVLNLTGRDRTKNGRTAPIAPEG